MSTRGALARDEVARPQPRPRPRPTAVRNPPRRRRRPRIRLGLLTIPLVALLFSGVVFINARELALVKRQGEVVRQTSKVQDQLAALTARQGRIDAGVRAWAEKTGMVSPSSDLLHYVTVRPQTAPAP